ncbi:MAG TPA: PAS domain-containing protein, partial [Kofleriaceae bacterium]|nr:PAS domain-containing protein [Kofleriaceae bacterium]
MTIATANIDRTGPSDVVENQVQMSLAELAPGADPARMSDDPEDFLDGAPVPIHRMDPTGTIVWANRAELELLGYPAEEYIGHPIVCFHADPAAAVDLLARLGRGETLRDYEVHLRARDGSSRHLLITANMIVRDGRPICARVFSR